MQVILDSYRSGIRVQSIDIQQSAAPAEVSEAFRAVNAAKQQREGYLNEARKFARQVTEQALGETAEFDQLYEQYRLAPEVTKRRLYYETMETVLSKGRQNDCGSGKCHAVPAFAGDQETDDAAKSANDVQVTGAK